MALEVGTLWRAGARLTPSLPTSPQASAPGSSLVNFPVICWTTMASLLLWGSVSSSVKWGWGWGGGWAGRRILQGSSPSPLRVTGQRELCIQPPTTTPIFLKRKLRPKRKLHISQRFSQDTVGPEVCMSRPQRRFNHLFPLQGRLGLRWKRWVGGWGGLNQLRWRRVDDWGHAGPAPHPAACCVPPAPTPATWLLEMRWGREWLGRDLDVSVQVLAGEGGDDWLLIVS